MYSLTFGRFCVIMEALLRGYVMNKIKNIIIRRILPTSVALSMAGFGGLPSRALSKDALPSYSYIESAFDTDELTKEEELAQVVVDYIQNKYPLEDDINSKAYSISFGPRKRNADYDDVPYSVSFFAKEPDYSLSSIKSE